MLLLLTRGRNSAGLFYMPVLGPDTPCSSRASFSPLTAEEALMTTYEPGNAIYVSILHYGTSQPAPVRAPLQEMGADNQFPNS